MPKPQKTHTNPEKTTHLNQTKNKSEVPTSLVAAHLPYPVFITHFEEFTDKSKLDGMELMLAMLTQKDFPLGAFANYLEAHNICFADNTTHAHFKAAAGDVKYFKSCPEQLSEINTYGVSAYGCAVITYNDYALKRLASLSRDAMVITNQNLELNSFAQKRNYIQIQMYVGNTFFHENEYDNAILSYRSAIEIYHDFQEDQIDNNLHKLKLGIMHSIASCEVKKGKHKRAVTNFKKALAYIDAHKLKLDQKVIHIVADQYSCLLLKMADEALSKGRHNNVTAIHEETYNLMASYLEDSLDTYMRLLAILRMNQTFVTENPGMPAMDADGQRESKIRKKIQEESETRKLQIDAIKNALELSWHSILNAEKNNRNLSLEVIDDQVSLLAKLSLNAWELRHYLMLRKCCNMYPELASLKSVRIMIANAYECTEGVSVLGKPEMTKEFVIIECIIEIMNHIDCSTYTKVEYDIYHDMTHAIITRHLGLGHVEKALDCTQKLDQFLAHFQNQKKESITKVTHYRARARVQYLLSTLFEREQKTKHQAIRHAKKAIELFEKTRALISLAPYEMNVYVQTVAYLAITYFHLKDYAKASDYLSSVRQIIGDLADDLGQEDSPFDHAKLEKDLDMIEMKMKKATPRENETKKSTKSPKITAPLNAWTQTKPTPKVLTKAEKKQNVIMHLERCAEQLKLLNATTPQQIDTIKNTIFKNDRLFAKKADQPKPIASIVLWSSSEEQQQALRFLYHTLKEKVKSKAIKLEIYQNGRGRIVLPMTDELVQSLYSLFTHHNLSRNIEGYAARYLATQAAKDSAPQSQPQLLSKSDKENFKILAKKLTLSGQFEYLEVDDSTVRVRIDFSDCYQQTGQYHLKYAKQFFNVDVDIFKFIMERLTALACQVSFEQHTLEIVCNFKTVIMHDEWRSKLLTPLCNFIQEYTPKIQQPPRQDKQTPKVFKPIPSIVAEATHEEPSNLDKLKQVIESLLPEEGISLSWLFENGKLKNRLIFSINMKQSPHIRVSQRHVSPANLIAEVVSQIQSVSITYHVANAHHPYPSISLSESCLDALFHANGELNPVRAHMQNWINRHASIPEFRTTVVGVTTETRQAMHQEVEAAKAEQREEDVVMRMVNFDAKAPEDFTHQVMSEASKLSFTWMHQAAEDSGPTITSAPTPMHSFTH